ncbi:MAG: hypothetical protein P9M14_04155 [Candidatus Alcyoniella australis]|nr:hypothetical protein [Candidatus Alcyoniella australis]
MSRRQNELSKVLTSLLCCMLILVLAGCEDPAVDEDQPIDLNDDDDAPYPYALVIGGGLSETLSVLKVEGPGEYVLLDDVRATGQSITQTLLHSGELYALCSLSNSVVVYDQGELQVQREISVGSGSNPIAMDFDSQGLAWIANFMEQDVSLYDLSTGINAEDRELARIALPEEFQLPGDEGWARHSGLLVVDQRVFVALPNLDGDFTANGPGVVIVIDRAERNQTADLTLTGSDTVGLVEDLQRGLLWAVSAGDYDQQDGFVGNGRVEAIDPQTLELVRDFEVNGAPIEMLIDEQGLGWLGNARNGVLTAIDLESGEQVYQVDLRDQDDPLGLSMISGLTLSPDGLLWVTEFNHDRLFAIDPLSGEKVESFVVNDGPDTLTVID